MSQHSSSGIADPKLVAARSLQLHRWYSTWYGAFGLANLVMIGLVAIMGPPWGWVLPIALGVIGLLPLLLWLRTNAAIAIEHRKASAVFWIGLVVLWAITCPLALSAPGRRWIFWVGGALMLVLGLVTAARIRAKSEREIDLDPKTDGAVF